MKAKLNILPGWGETRISAPLIFKIIDFCLSCIVGYDCEYSDVYIDRFVWVCRIGENFSFHLKFSFHSRRGGGEKHSYFQGLPAFFNETGERKHSSEFSQFLKEFFKMAGSRRYVFGACNDWRYLTL